MLFSEAAALQHFRLLEICEEKCAPKNASYSEWGEKLRANEKHPGKTEEHCSAALLPAPTSLPQQSRSVVQSLVGILVRAASEFMEALKKSETAAQRGE